MACNAVTLNTIDARCESSIGGIKRILIALSDDVATVSLDASGQVSGVTMVSGKVFSEWKFRHGTGNYTSTLTADATIGSSSIGTDVVLQFTKAEALKRLYIQNAINANAVVIVEDNYGQHLYLGLDNEVTVTAATMQSGTANGDLNGFNLTLHDESKELPHFMSMTKAQIDALLTAE